MKSFTVLVAAVGFLAQAVRATDFVITDKSGVAVEDYAGNCWTGMSRHGAWTSVCPSDKHSTTASVAPTSTLQKTSANQVVPQRSVESASSNAEAKHTYLVSKFESSKSLVHSTNAKQMGDLVSQAKKSQGPVIVKGYADYTGSAVLNGKLAQQRALAVKKILVDRGVPRNKIRLEAVAPATEAGRSPCANLSGTRLSQCLSSDRRAEVVIPAFAR